MEDTEHLRSILEPLINACGAQLVELAWVNNDGEKTLQVAIMRPDGTMDLDTCAAVSEKLSEALDQQDVSAGRYTLEVCSPGAEREIKDLAELTRLPYVYVRLRHPVNKKLELTGQVEAYQDHTVTLAYREKAVLKHGSFPDADIEFIRHAVKF